MFALRRALRPLNVAAASLQHYNSRNATRRKAPPSASTSARRAAVGGFRNGKVEILANAEGMRTTPSYVALSTGHERLVGDAAKNQAARTRRAQFMMRNA